MSMQLFAQLFAPLFDGLRELKIPGRKIMAGEGI